MEPANDCGATVLTIIMANAPGTIAALAALITTLQVKQGVRGVRHRADQLYNGEFARGRAQGHREDVGQTGDFTLR